MEVSKARGQIVRRPRKAQGREGWGGGVPAGGAGRNGELRALVQTARDNPVYSAPGAGRHGRG